VIEVSRTSTETKQALHSGIAQAGRNANVPIGVPDGMKTAPGDSPGAISAGSGDTIRTCDLWVMS
jgi:hypothetical protein